MINQIFQFKQFAVDQTGCAMKINTDGVLLGAIASVDQPKHILDIGTGTGVIALMLAQRFIQARIDAVEIDESAAVTAQQNFGKSPFANRLQCYPQNFETFFAEHGAKKYDLIISNPPFYIRTLKSPKELTTLAKHTDEGFFDKLLKTAVQHLTDNGLLWLVMPVNTSKVVKALAKHYGLFVRQLINIKSYTGSEPHRHVLAFSKELDEILESDFVIYDAPKQYTDLYQQTLKDFFTIF